MALFQDNPVAFLLSTAVLLITTSCFLAISISLHSAYLWLAVVFVALIFLATFTCTYSLPDYFVHDISTQSQTECVQSGQSNLLFENETNIHPYWIPVDLPPAYDVVVGINPPSYSKATGEVMKPSNFDIPIFDASTSNPDFGLSNYDSTASNYGSPTPICDFSTSNCDISLPNFDLTTTNCNSSSSFRHSSTTNDMSPTGGLNVT